MSSAYLIAQPVYAYSAEAKRTDSSESSNGSNGSPKRRPLKLMMVDTPPDADDAPRRLPAFDFSKLAAGTRTPTHSGNTPPSATLGLPLMSPRKRRKSMKGAALEVAVSAKLARKSMQIKHAPRQKKTSDDELV